jgi:myo-inositol 2-dehydrogenase / D-chiro-inositol 1-dehydrogenase
MSTTRRDFLKTATTAALGSAIVPGTGTGIFGGRQRAAGSDAIRIGLVGCGGRGTGAVDDAISSSAGVTLVAMGDMFPDRLTSSRTQLSEKFGKAIDVTPDRSFTGLDAYQKVIASDVNYIILATPPGFRPIHIAAAVAANKNIFTEKPVAVDGPGIRAVLEVYEAARAKGLGIATGTQRRHQTGYVETMKRLHDGAIGDIVSARCYWNQGFLWKKDRQAEWTDVEWQLRNWLYFTWLSGDHIVEQHVHNIDAVNWAMQAHPVRANGMGGRQVRTSPDYGHIFDHFAIDYEYANGATLASQCRQIEGCDKSVSEALIGTKGSSQVDKYTIAGARAWKFEAQDNRPYVQEHTDFIASIRAGKPYNELKTTAESTLTAIMGRMSAYTGKVVTWEQALNSKEQLMPQGLTLGPLPTPAVAVPGQTPLV